MRVLFYLAAAHRRAEKLAEEMEKSLSETAVAFGHSFVIRTGAPDGIPEDAAAVLFAEEQEIEDMARALHMSAMVRVFPGALNTSVLANGGAVRGSVRRFLPGTLPGALDIKALPEKLAEIIKNPQSMGDCDAEWDAGRVLISVAEALSGQRLTAYDILESPKRSLYAAPVPRKGDLNALSPFGAYYATAGAMMNVPGLEEEARCMLTAVNNVWQAGWRTGDFPYAEGVMEASRQEIGERVNEQISLVGELMNRG